MAGGYGNAAHGRHQLGAASSDIEPRFMQSEPADGAHNVSLNQWLEYIIYYYSSTPDVDDPSIRIEVSEDNGISYADAAAAPYSTTIRYRDGQELWIKIRKAAPWTQYTTVLIRTTYPDEFGQAVTKVMPVKWGALT